MFPSAPCHLVAPQGSQLSAVNLLPQPLWLCVQNRNKLLKRNHHASATSSEASTGRHCEPHRKRHCGQEHEVRERSVSLLPSATC